MESLLDLIYIVTIKIPMFNFLSRTDKLHCELVKRKATSPEQLTGFEVKA